MNKEERFQECVKAYAENPTKENLEEVRKATKELDRKEGTTRVIAIQVDGEVKDRLDDYLQRTGQRLKNYLTSLILYDIEKGNRELDKEIEDYMKNCEQANEKADEPKEETAIEDPMKDIKLVETESGATAVVLTGEKAKEAEKQRKEQMKKSKKTA